MNNVNFQKELEKIIASLDGGDQRPKLLLHSCCAPCSSYCLIYLLPHFDITCLYYNPNITDEEEYNKRYAELVRFCKIVSKGTVLFDNFCPEKPVEVLDGGYDPDGFISRAEASGLTECPEGGKRCEMCFSMRLGRAYEIAAAGGYDYFTTTLTISPLKDAKIINRIGYAIAEAHEGGPMWLPSDFKKNDGYKRSIELSREYGLYRQNYCGCTYSKNQYGA